MSYRRTSCRGCGGVSLRPILDLGTQPLANRFLERSELEDPEPAFPLDLFYCQDCHLVQLMEVVDPEVLFSRYIYVTGTSETIARHNQGYAQAVLEQRKLPADALVVEVASNDGSLLKCFGARGVRTLGIEPAVNIAGMANQDGVETVNCFFNAEAGRTLRAERGPAKVVVGNNVLAHVDEPIDFLEGAAALLDSDGCVVVEVPYLLEFLDRLEYDTIYHEHLCYFSVAALQNIFRRAGLEIIQVDEVSVHGGSIRVWAEPLASNPQPRNVQAFLERERQAGATDVERFVGFADQVEATRTQLNALVDGLRSDGHSIAAYAAPAKGNTLLNYCGLGPDRIDFTVDRSPLKVGMYTPGMKIPVLEAAELERRQPDYALILAWNFADEIMRQQARYLEKGGRFILPLPTPRIVPGLPSQADADLLSSGEAR